MIGPMVHYAKLQPDSLLDEMKKIRLFSKSTPVTLIFSYFVLILLWNLVTSLLNDRYFRQRTIINSVDEYSKLISFESIHHDEDFIKFSNKLKDMKNPPFLIFYDSGNIDITLNHICNLNHFPGALSRLAMVSFDRKGHSYFLKNYPEIPNVVVNLDPVKESLDNNLQNRRYILYQIIFLLRARVSASLALRNISFWSMHQDSLWVDDFAGMHLETHYPDSLMLFDTVGNDLIPKYKRLEGWICGSTFFARGGQTTYKFFRQVDTLMRSRQSPDSSIMTYLCNFPHFKCNKMPRWVISSFNYFLGPRQHVPSMIQVDSLHSSSKMEQFKKANFIFVHSNGTCNGDAVSNIREPIRRAFLDELNQDNTYEESAFAQFKYSMHEIFNIDRLNSKDFLRVHEMMV